MKPIYSWGIAACAVGAGTWAFSSSKPDAPGREVLIKGGRTAINFLPNTLKASRLTVDFTKVKDDENCNSCSLPGFQFKDSDLRFRVIDGKLVRFDEGKISHKGSFKLKTGEKTISADQMTLTPNGNEGDLSLSVDSEKGRFVAFELRKPKNVQKTTRKQVVLQDMQVLVSDDLAKQLGDPGLAGEEVGSVTLYAESEPADGGGDVEYAEAPAAAGLDISLSAMSNLSVATSPVGKVGTFPNGRTGLSMSTTSCNVGTVNVPWNAPMQTTHPVIALNLYRLQNGRFEHVGWSWLKHGFLSTNSNGCGSCQNPGTGSLLGLNCSDTYGTGNNGDRTYLGGRDEVNPFTGVWTCTNSWFSNYQNDCTRRNPGAVTLDAVDHRLDCLDSDLGNAGARYFYEAYYITSNDINTYNNLGSREATLTWTGSTWSIATIDSMIQGPAINRWGDMRSTATPQTEGDVIVAVQVTNNGNGTWHYEYAVYNHNLDRQVREFSVPLPYGATVSNIGFRDIDRDANNGWTPTQSDHALTWSSPTFGSSGTNPLKYSSVFNFRFDANVEPASTSTAMGLFKPGQNGTLTAATRGPLFLEPVTSFSLVNATQRSGNLASLEDVDADRLTLGPEDFSSRSGSGIITSDSAPAGAINQITLGVRSSNTLTGLAANQTLELWNWNTSAWEVLDTRTTSTSDSTAQLTINSNAARFVNTSTREVKLRVLHKSNVGNSGNRWTLSIDQIGFHYN